MIFSAFLFWGVKLTVLLSIPPHRGTFPEGNGGGGKAGGGQGFLMNPERQKQAMKKENEKYKKKKEARILFSLSRAYRGFLNFSLGCNGREIAGAKIWLFIWLEYQGNIKDACKG